jgi:long-chain acyl-CoA synthetase
VRAIAPGLTRCPTIVHALAAAVSQSPYATALICEDRQLTYAQLGRAVAGLARRLVELGVRGQRVATLLPNSIEAVVTALAVLAARAQLAPLNPFFKAPELAAALDEAEPCLVVAAGAGSATLLELGATRRLPRMLAADGADFNLSAWLADESLDLSGLALPEPDELGLLIFTGGTTGTPKGVEHTHAALATSLLQHCTLWPVAFGIDRFLSVAPLFHVWGLVYATFVPIYARGTLVLVPRYDPERVLSAIEQHRISVFGGGPAPIYMGLVNSPAYRSTDFSSLRYCLSGGSPCPLELHEAWQSHVGCPLLEGWGMSEAAPLCLNNARGPRKARSVGQAVPLTQVSVVDLDTGRIELAPHRPGEVRVRGPQQMKGYRNRPEETQAVLRDGWLYTGDIGYLDEEGFLFLVDRKKDLVIVGGYNDYPRTVDEVLFGHPCVAEAATVGRPDEKLGEVLVAFIVRKPGTNLDEAELSAFCASQMVKYRRPAEVFFLDALPRTGARKIDKQALRALAAASSVAR